MFVSSSNVDMYVSYYFNHSEVATWKGYGFKLSNPGLRRWNRMVLSKSWGDSMTKIEEQVKLLMKICDKECELSRESLVMECFVVVLWETQSIKANEGIENTTRQVWETLWCRPSLTRFGILIPPLEKWESFEHLDKPLRQVGEVWILWSRGLGQKSLTQKAEMLKNTIWRFVFKLLSPMRRIITTRKTSMRWTTMMLWFVHSCLCWECRDAWPT